MTYRSILANWRSSAFACALAATACAGAARPSAPNAAPRDGALLAPAGRLADLLVKRDFAAAQSFIEANAAPGSHASRLARHLVRALGTLLVTDGWRADTLEQHGSTEVVAQLADGAGGLFGVEMLFEPRAPFRFVDVHPTRGEPRRRKPAQLAADHPAAHRAREVVRAINESQSAEARQFVAAAWRLQADETIDEAVSGLERARTRTGAPITLVSVAAAADGLFDVEVVNARGRVSTITLAVGSDDRVAIAGLDLQAEREVTDEETLPRIVELAEPVVTVPVEFASGRPVVEVTIEGKGPFRMLVETGTMGMELTPAAIARIGGGLESVTDDNLYRTATGFVDHLHRVRDLRLGGLRLGDFVMATNPNVPGADGYLGLAAFKQLLLTVDYPRRQLRLEKGALPEPDGRSILGMRRVFGQYYGIDAAVGNDSMPLLIDTQSGLGLSMSPELARRVGFAAPPVNVGEVIISGNLRSPFQAGRLAGDLAFGRYTIQQPIALIIAHAPNRPRLGNIGAQILRNFEVTMDQANERVRFVRDSAAIIPAPPSLRSFGMTLASARDGSITVSKVDARGPAERAGVKEGDVVVRVADAPAATLRANGASAQSTLTDIANRGGAVAFELTRGGQPVRVQLESEVVVK